MPGQDAELFQGEGGSSESELQSHAHYLRLSKNWCGGDIKTPHHCGSLALPHIVSHRRDIARESLVETLPNVSHLEKTSIEISIEIEWREERLFGNLN